MAELAIAAAISIGIGAAQAALTPKPKRQRVDRGRGDDLRLMTAEEGVFLPRVKGWGRAAPIIIWSTPTVERAVEHAAGGGGKGLGGGQATEPDVSYTYTRSLCCAIAEGPVWNGLRRIWAGNEVIFNATGTNGGYYEAEDATTFTGTTSVQTYEAASGRREITLAPAATIQFNDVLSYGAKTRPLTIYFRTDAIDSFKLYVNGVLILTSTFQNSGNTSYNTKTVQVALNDGNNTIKIENTSARNVGIDRIFCFPGFADSDQVTGIISDGDFSVIASDPDNPSPYFNDPPTVDPGGGGFGGGAGSGTVNGLGGAQFFFYLGTEDQPQDPTMVAADGEDQVPAYRKVFHCVIKDLTTNDPELPNLTFEFDEGTHDLAQAVTDEYKDAGAKDDELDMSELAGIHFIGLVTDQMRPLSETLKPLEEFYNFDLLPIDGKIKAVLRGGDIVETITEDDLAAYEEGSEPPAGPWEIDYTDPHALPVQALVSYLDVAKDYHNATEPVQRAVGINRNPLQLNYPIVAEADDAIQVGLRELYRPYLERPVRFTTGPKFHHLSPTDPIMLVKSNQTQRVRITGEQATPGGGLIKWKGVTESIGVYTQSLAPGGNGFEPQLTEYPPNSVFVIIDAPLIRPEDAGDGTSPVIIIAMCKRGTSRPWRGGVVFKEEIADDFQRKTAFANNCAIGQVRGTLGPCSDPTVFDRTHSVTVDFWNDETFESYEESDLLERPYVNLLWIGINGGTGEYAQAAIVTPTTPLAGYKSAFTFSTLLRGRFTTEYATDTHTSDELLVRMDPNVKPRREDLSEIDIPRRWVGASVGQGINEALVHSALTFTLRANSLKDPSPIINAIKGLNSDLLISPRRRARFGATLADTTDVPLGEEQERFLVEILDATQTQVLHKFEIGTDVTPQPVMWKVFEPRASGTVVPLADGTVKFSRVNVTTTEGTFAYFGGSAISQQSFLARDVWLHFTIPYLGTEELPVLGGPPQRIGIALAGANPSQHPEVFYFELNAGMRAEGDADSVQNFTSGTTFSLHIKDGVGYYFKDYVSGASAPFFISRHEVLDLPYCVTASDLQANTTLGVYQALNVRLERSDAEALYTAEMQKAENGGVLPSTITVRARQISALVGLGQPSIKVF